MTNREKLLRDFNNAFLTNDVNYIINQLTDDVVWDMVGDQKISGKENVQAAMEAMAGSMKTLEMKVEQCIMQDRQAAVCGTMKMLDKGNEITFGFCDVYTFSESENDKIKAMNSYVVPLKN